MDTHELIETNLSSLDTIEEKQKYIRTIVGLPDYKHLAQLNLWKVEVALAIFLSLDPRIVDGKFLESYLTYLPDDLILKTRNIKELIIDHSNFKFATIFAPELPVMDFIDSPTNWLDWADPIEEIEVPRELVEQVAGHSRRPSRTTLETDLGIL